MSKSERSMIQIIKENEEFNQDELKTYLEPLLFDVESHETETSGSLTPFVKPPFNRKNSKFDTLSYHTISIFGPQSSGKSTLLNYLFDTKFAVMSTEAYSQCTLGIYFSITDVASEKVFVLDVEGTDSPERQQHGDANQSFEKRVSLFALAVSEVLLVNLWAKDANRYQASNYSLLKTVFEMNLQLFYQESQQSKTLLLFVLRDFDGSHAADAIKNQIESHVEKIWESCSKPKGRENVQVYDLFDVKIELLPHKNLQKQEFLESIEDMKTRFLNKESDEYIFKEKYHKRVPLAGFDVYTKNIWDQIMENKDLNIPAQKEILAEYRCKEISEEIMSHFQAQCDEWIKISKSKQIEDFGNVAAKTIDTLINEFEKSASLYVEKVVQKFATNLRNQMISLLAPVVVNLAVLYRKAIETEHKEKIHKLVSSTPNKVVSNFVSSTDKILADAKAEFIQSIEKISLPGQEWDYQYILNDLVEVITQVIAEERSKQLKLLLQNEKDLISAMIDKKLQSKSSGLLNAPKSTFWTDLRDAMDSWMEKEIEGLSTTFNEFNVTDEEKESMISEMKQYAKNQTRKALSDYSRHLLQHMRSTFSSKFPPMDITSLSLAQIIERFKNVRQEALELLDIFFLFRYNPEHDSIHLKFPEFTDENSTQSLEIEIPSDIPSEDFLISNHDVKTIYMEFTHAINVSLMQTKHEKERQSQTSIPVWIYFALLLLGWNELMYILRNPLVLLLVIGLGAVYLYIRFKDGFDEFINSIENPTVKLALLMASEYLPANLINIKKEDLKEKKEK